MDLDGHTKTGLRNMEAYFAQPDDVEGILSVQKDNLLSSIEEAKKFRKRGFLIHALEAGELAKLILDRENNLVLVAKEKDGIDGYALAYNLRAWKNIKPQWEKTVNCPENVRELLLRKNVLYLRHIARKTTTEKIGRKLIAVLISEAMSRNYDAIIAEILVNPVVNEASTEFHEYYGFNKVGEVKECEKITWGLFLKNLK